MRSVVPGVVPVAPWVSQGLGGEAIVYDWLTRQIWKVSRSPEKKPGLYGKGRRPSVGRMQMRTQDGVLSGVRGRGTQSCWTVCPLREREGASMRWSFEMMAMPFQEELQMETYDDVR